MTNKSAKTQPAGPIPDSTEPPVAERFEQVPIGRLIENKHNPRKQFNRIDELAESIRCNGVIEPLVVREAGLPSPMAKNRSQQAVIDALGLDPDSKQKYEIICGARRYRASRQAGLAVVPCIIRQLTDLQVALCMLEENANREDVHPLQEADGIAHAIELGGDIDTVAAKMGRDVSYVARRLQLQKLTKKARKLFEDDTINVGHAMELARLPADQQDRLAGRITNPHTHWVMSVRELRELIAKDTLRPLDGARWKKDDVELVPKAGACTLCPKNTANATALFNDISASKPHCTDPGCYEQKQERFVQLEVHRLRELGTPPAVITTGYDDRKLKKQFGEVRNKWSIDEITPKQAKTLKPEEVGRGIFVDGDRAGETVLFKIDPDDARQDDGADRYKREQQAKQRKADRETAANFAVIDALLPKVDGSTPVLAVIARAQFGRLMQDHQKLICKRRGWQKPAKQRDGGSGWMHHAVEAFLDLAKQQELLAFMVECALATSAKVSLWYHGDKDDLKRLSDLAKHLGIDAGAIRQRVIDEAKEKEKQRAKGKSAKAQTVPVAKAKSRSGQTHRTCRSCGEYLEPPEKDLCGGCQPAASPAPADNFDDDVQILTPAEAGIDLATLEGNDCQGQLESADGVPAIGSLEWSSGLWAVVGRQMVRGRNCWKLCALAKTSKKPVENTYRGADLAERAKRGVFDGAVVQARKSWWVICDKPGNTPADQVFIADSAAGLAGAA